MSLLSSLHFPYLLAQPPPVAAEPRPVRRREIFDLGEYRSNRVYYFAGNNLNIEQLTAGSVVRLRFDDPDALLITVRAGHSFPLQPFNRIYLSNAIQVGSTLTVSFDYYGFNSENQSSEALSALNESLNDLRLNPLRLIDAGLLVEADVAGLINAVVVLYTVPAARAFYFLGYDFDIYEIDPAAIAGGNMIYNDGANHFVATMDLPAGDTGRHTQNTFSMLRLAAGSTISASSDANSQVSICIWGIETTA